MNCAVGFYGYVGQVQVAWIPMLLVTGGTIPGIATGTHARASIETDYPPRPTSRTMRRGFDRLADADGAALLAFLRSI
jgi:hypothetical protein